MLERFVYNPKGYIAIMKSAAVEADLQDRADRVKAAAEAMLPADAGEVEIIADTQVGRTRAGATVIGVPTRIEADERILGRAIDAAR